MEFYLLIFFSTVTFSHALTLIWAKSNKNSGLVGKLWKVHYLLNGLLWIALAAWILLIQFKIAGTKFPFWIQVPGILIIAGGMFLSFSGFKRLGIKQAMGFRFFSKGKTDWLSGGVFSVLRNPIYDGFCLILFGLWLFTGIFLNFYLAVANIVLLNIFLASIENNSPKFWQVF